MKIRSIQFIFEQRWLQGVYTHVGHVCEGALEYTKHAQTPNTHTLSISCINALFLFREYARQTHSVPTLRRRSVGAFPHTTAVDPPPVVQEREEGDEYEGDGNAGEKSERVKLWMHGEGTWPRTWEDIGICVCVCVCVCVECVVSVGVMCGAL